MKNSFNREPKEAAWTDPQRKGAATAPISLPDHGRKGTLTKGEKSDERLDDEQSQLSWDSLPSVF